MTRVSGVLVAQDLLPPRQAGCDHHAQRTTMVVHVACDGRRTGTPSPPRSRSPDCDPGCRRRERWLLCWPVRTGSGTAEHSVALGDNTRFEFFSPAQCDCNDGVGRALDETHRVDASRQQAARGRRSQRGAGHQSERLRERRTRGPWSRKSEPSTPTTILRSVDSTICSVVIAPSFGFVHLHPSSGSGTVCL